FWSLATLMHELGTIYKGEKNGHRVSLPPLTFQYTDYVAWQSRMLAGPKGKQDRAYWEQQLAGELPVLNLPTDRPRPLVATFNGASTLFKLNAQLTQTLKE